MSMSEKTQAAIRIASLVDEGSFVEIGALVEARATDFNLQNAAAPGDGVITGYATIEGKLVFLYSQDESVLAGSIGEMHAKKIVKIYDMAMKMGAPVVGLVASSGLRLEESTDALEGFGSLYAASAKASGVIPQIMAVFGTCGGGMAVLAGMSDFVLMDGKKGHLFVNAPNTLDNNYTEKCDISTAAYQSAKTGLADVYTEEEIFGAVRDLIAVLPSNNDEPAVEDSDDDLNRLTSQLENVRDIRDLAAGIADSYRFIEVRKAYAPDTVTGFVRLDGITCGVIGNEEEKLSADGCKKAAAFVNFCDAYEIPVVTFTNVTGFEATLESEKAMALSASALTFAFANATVPKINVILDKAYGSAYTAMNSKAIGADIVYALEGAKIGMMDASMAAKIIEKDTGKIEKAAELFDEKQTALAAAKRGYVDEIISEATLRKNILIALEMLYSKREDIPYKKHTAK